MKHRLVSWLLKCYPRGWRSEYGGEMEDLLRREPLTISTACNVLSGALRERVRQPRARFVIGSMLASGGLFTLAVLCSPLLWRVVAGPVTRVLIDQKLTPPMLVATPSWEQPSVVCLGIPLLVTLFAAYPVSVALACRKSVLSRRVKTTAKCSAALYAAGFVAGFAAWHCGSFRWLLQLGLQSQNVQAVSMTECFGLLAASTLGTAVILQVPLLLLHSWHAKAEPL